MEREITLRRNRSGTSTSLLLDSGLVMNPLYSLASILQKRALSSTKLDEIKTKANILAAFAVEEVEEARDTIERAIEDL